MPPLFFAVQVICFALIASEVVLGRGAGVVLREGRGGTKQGCRHKRDYRENQQDASQYATSSSIGVNRGCGPRSLTLQGSSLLILDEKIIRSSWKYPASFGEHRARAPGASSQRFQFVAYRMGRLIGEYSPTRHHAGPMPQ